MVHIGRTGGDGGDEAVVGGAGLGTRVQQQEAARAVGVLCLAGLEAALAEQRRLLVAGHARDGNARRHARVAGLAKAPRRAPDLGHHAGRNAKQVEQPRVPAAFVDVVEHGAACVGDVGGMHEPAGEHPNQPGVHRAKEQLAALGTLARTGHVVEDPRDLARGEVRVGQQTGLGLDLGSHLGVAAELVDHGGSAAALPHDGVGHRLARGGVPHDGGLALVVDADACDVLGTQAMALQQLGQTAQLREQNLLRVMLDPAWLGVDLRELALHHVDHLAVVVDQHRTRRRGALVERHHIARLACRFAHLRYPSIQLTTSSKTT